MVLVFEKERNSKVETTELTQEEFNKRYKPFNNMLLKRIFALGTRLDINESYRTDPFRKFPHTYHLKISYPDSILHWLEDEEERQKLLEAEWKRKISLIADISDLP